MGVWPSDSTIDVAYLQDIRDERGPLIPKYRRGSRKMLGMGPDLDTFNLGPGLNCMKPNKSQVYFWVGFVTEDPQLMPPTGSHLDGAHW